MTLADRVEAVRGQASQQPASRRTESPWAGDAQNGSIWKDSNSHDHSADANDALSAVKERAGAALYERMGSRITDSSLDEAELHD